MRAIAEAPTERRERRECSGALRAAGHELFNERMRASWGPSKGS